MLIIRRTAAFLRAIWKSLTLIGTVVGLLYLWPDIQELPTIYPRMFGWLPMFERETLMAFALGLALLWILWMDARPTVRSWWQRQRRSKDFTILEGVHCDTYYIKSAQDGESTDYFQNNFYLVVGNALDTGQTLKRVQARVFFHGPPALCRIRDSSTEEIDIRHGEWAYFEIGKLVSKEMMGDIRASVDFGEDKLWAYRHNIPLGGLSFEVGSVSKEQEYGLGHRPEEPNVWSLFLVVSADDVKTAQARISIDMTKTRSPVSCELVV